MSQGERDPPRFVRDSVSFANPTLKLCPSNSVTVRHAPLIQIESPTWQSDRMGEAWVKVNVKPEEEVVGVMEATWQRCSIWRGDVREGEGETER